MIRLVSTLAQKNGQPMGGNKGPIYFWERLGYTLTGRANNLETDMKLRLLINKQKKCPGYAAFRARTEYYLLELKLWRFSNKVKRFFCLNAV